MAARRRGRAAATLEPTDARAQSAKARLLLAGGSSEGRRPLWLLLAGGSAQLPLRRSSARAEKYPYIAYILLCDSLHCIILDI